MTHPHLADPDQPPGIDTDSCALPPASEAAERVLAFVAWFGDGAIFHPDDEQFEVPGNPPLFARDLEAVAKAARSTPTPTNRPNPVLADALHYYAERRTMNNSKGWDHVLRKTNQAIGVGAYPTATATEIAEACAILATLAEPNSPDAEQRHAGIAAAD